MMHRDLNPKFWQDDVLRPEVRQSLIRVARAFLESSDIDSNLVRDLELVGSMAGWNWHSASDCDLHIKIDWHQIRCDSDPETWLRRTQRLWNLEHDIWIRAHEVEVYLEDPETSVLGTRYSIMRDQWIVHPRDLPQSPKDPETADVLRSRLRQIQRVLDKPTETRVQIMIDQLKQDRRLALRQGGQTAAGNLVYKQLRNWGILQSLRRLALALEDRRLGLL